MERYFGTFQLGKFYTNPWRADKHPKCYFSYRNGTLYLVDFGNDIKNINCFQACMYYYSCSYWDCLEKIDIDFNLKLTPSSIFNVKNNVVRKFQNTIKSSNTDLEIHPVTFTFEYKEFDDQDFDYWIKKNRYSKELVEQLKIRSCSRVYRNGVLWSSSFIGNPIYTYSDSLGEFKLYHPYHKVKKWRNIRTIIEGGELLVEDDLLFITSSYKDVGTIKMLGYQACAPNSETSYKMIYDSMEKFKQMYKHIYIFHNSDETGKSFSIKITKEHNLNYINIPDKYLAEGITDPTDFSSKYGLDKLNEIINEKLIRDGLENFIKS